MNIIGISAYYHESACCLIKNGALLAAAEEERFSRVKHDAKLPLAAFRYCLSAGGLDITDIDCLAYYESPDKKLARQLWTANQIEAAAPLLGLDARRPEREIRELLGYEGPIDYFDHHLSHAASTFFFSGFTEAAILTVDGVGEWATTTYGTGQGRSIEFVEQVEFPHSLGLLYSTVTSYLGFAVNSGEYKVMGLAPYGEPRFVDRVRRLIESMPGGQYRLDMAYFDFLAGARMFSDRFCDLFGAPPRTPESEITQFHQDVARSMQLVLEEILVEKAQYLHDRIGSDNLCMAGGVALNCVANARILGAGPFKQLFVQPAAGDAGGCLGAAALAHVKHTGTRHSMAPLQHVYLGPRFAPRRIGLALSSMGLRPLHFGDRHSKLLEAIVDRLVAGNVVAWFCGGMEFGPRALGARSILADPRIPDMRDRLNRLVKRREAFRPFAPSILVEHARDHLDLDHPSPFMLETCAVTSPFALPAITHVDGSARPQTVDRRHAPRFAALLDAFARRTGCPMLVNTSFNVRDEPIVCSPMDALTCVVDSEIDCLVLEGFLIDREMIAPALAELLHHQQGTSRRARERAVSSAVYTFI